VLETSVELLGVLSLSALPLGIAFCIVGSIVAAVRAVSRGTAPKAAAAKGQIPVSLTLDTSRENCR
jgi:hypothetical protein